jgi:spermidine/putrescine transport system permease protein
MKKQLFSRSRLGIPYAVFLILFVALPMLIILYYALTNGEGKFTPENVITLFRDGRVIGTLGYSLAIALITTALCLLIAYPVAYILAKGPYQNKNVLLMLFVMPMWINFTLRLTAFKEVLTVVEGNLAFHPFLNTILCMTYDFLPFMILPLYNTIVKIDDSFTEAALDLGAKKKEVFLSVILPLSVPGIVSGVTMVLLPAMTNYVVLDMIYNSTYIMGSLIGSYFNAYDWGSGSVISLLLLLIIFLISFATGEFSENHEEEKGGAVL